MSMFFKRKTLWVPTFFGWLVIFPLPFILFYILLITTYPFLAIKKQPTSDMLVVEGWIPEYGLKNAIDYYHDHHYKYMVITGVPITQWSYSSPYSNMADASARSMREMYFRDSIYTASIPSTVVRDRTYSTAVALKMKMLEGRIPYQKFDLYTMGAHARRSHLMFEKAIDTLISGVINETDLSFEPDNWFRTSYGFRIVSSEYISYMYSRLFFFPSEKETFHQILDGRIIDSIQKIRFAKDAEFADSTSSPLEVGGHKLFKGLHYFPIKMSWKVKAKFEVDTSSALFKMKTSTTRLPEYRKYANVTFILNDTIRQLTVFQNMDHLKKYPGTKYLFLPFKDRTNGIQSYGGGRYLDLEITDNDSITIDFNMAYNPYCAYASRWSCPIPPPENYLDILIEAGEQKYHE
jgi:uncharacterized protein (DUF1684 family)